MDATECRTEPERGCSVRNNPSDGLRFHCAGRTAGGCSTFRDGDATLRGARVRDGMGRADRPPPRTSLTQNPHIPEHDELARGGVVKVGQHAAEHEYRPGFGKRTISRRSWMTCGAAPPGASGRHSDPDRGIPGSRDLDERRSRLRAQLHGWQNRVREIDIPPASSCCRRRGRGEIRTTRNSPTRPP